MILCINEISTYIKVKQLKVMTKVEVSDSIEKEIQEKSLKLNKNIKQNREQSIPTNEMVLKILRLLEIQKEDPKIQSLSPSEIQVTLGIKDNKVVCDKLWNLRKQGFLISPKRGFYEFPTTKKVE